MLGVLKVWPVTLQCCTDFTHFSVSSFLPYQNSYILILKIYSYMLICWWSLIFVFYFSLSWQKWHCNWFLNMTEFIVGFRSDGGVGPRAPKQPGPPLCNGINFLLQDFTVTGTTDWQPMRICVCKYEKRVDVPFHETWVDKPQRHSTVIEITCYTEQAQRPKSVKCSNPPIKWKNPLQLAVKTSHTRICLI